MSTDNHPSLWTVLFVLLIQFRRNVKEMNNTTCSVQNFGQYNFQLSISELYLNIEMRVRIPVFLKIQIQIGAYRSESLLMDWIRFTMAKTSGTVPFQFQCYVYIKRRPQF